MFAPVQMVCEIKFQMKKVVIVNFRASCNCDVIIDQNVFFVNLNMYLNCIYKTVPKVTVVYKYMYTQN